MNATKTALTILLLAFLLTPCVPSGNAAEKDPLEDYSQALFFMTLEKWDQALPLLNAVISAKPDFAPAYYNRGIAYSKKGQYDKSIEDLKKVIQLDPSHLDAYGLLGMVYEIKKDLPAAMKSYRSALSATKDPAAKKALEKWIATMEEKMKKGR